MEKRFFQGSEFQSAFPPSFDFYHLGRVELQSVGDRTLPRSEVSAALYRLEGDVQAQLVCVFSRELDYSTYSELGNILASRFSDFLTRSHGLSLKISSPQPILRPQLEQLMVEEEMIAQRSYLHYCEGSTIAIELLVFDVSREKSGNA